MIKNRYYSSIKKKFHDLSQSQYIMDSPLSTEIKSTMITQEENDNVSMLSLSNNIISNNLFDIQTRYLLNRENLEEKTKNDTLEEYDEF